MLADRMRIAGNQLPKWEKYTTNETTVYSSGSFGPWSDYEPTTIYSNTGGYFSYGFSSTAPGYYTSGERKLVLDYPNGTSFYNNGNIDYNNYLRESQFIVTPYEDRAVRRRTRYMQSETVYSKGDYIETVTAEEGTYPDNGRHTDGYWYVKI